MIARSQMFLAEFFKRLFLKRALREIRGRA